MVIMPPKMLAKANGMRIRLGERFRSWAVFRKPKHPPGVPRKTPGGQNSPQESSRIPKQPPGGHRRAPGEPQEPRIKKILKK